MARTLSNPTIKINGRTIRIVPNSFSYKEGQGDKTVRAQSAGGNAVETVVAENAETKMSMAKFKMFNTSENLQLAKDWLESFSNTIRAFESNINIPFRNMVVTTEPERIIGADGDFEIEFMGDPIL